MRSVMVSTNHLRRDIFGRIQQRRYLFWSFAGDAKTVIVCGKAEDSVSTKIEWQRPLCALWDSYTSESRIDGRPVGISKVVYDNMVVHSDVFRCSAVLQVGFETTLYHSTVQVPITDISCHAVTDKRHEKWFDVDYIKL